MTTPLNDGSRPSRLDLGRAWTGEVSTDHRDPAFDAALAATTVAPFDFQALLARAATLDKRQADHPADDPVDAPYDASRPDARRSPPEPAPLRRAARSTTGGGATGGWRRALAYVAIVAAAAVALLVAVRPGEGRLKGGHSDLGYYVQRGDQVFPGDPARPVRAGDAVQFTYRTTADSMVLLSVDADGVISVFWPSRGDAPVQVTPGERRVLDGSVVLDDAPSPEVFVGFFGDWTVARARDEAAATYAEGGIDAVTALADDDELDIATLSLEKLD